MAAPDAQTLPGSSFLAASHCRHHLRLQLKELRPIELDKLQFVGDSLRLLKGEVGSQAAVLGFVGCPWTLATYIVEGASSSLYKTIKTMMFTGAAEGWG